MKTARFAPADVATSNDGDGRVHTYTNMYDTYACGMAWPSGWQPFFWGIGMSKAYNEIRRKHLTRARKADEEFAAEIEHRNSTDYM